MNTQHLSTMTMVKAVAFSEDWNEQRSMLEELARRRDLYNLEPILNVAVDQTHHFTVRRAATECVATHNETFTLQWLRRKAENHFTPASQRKMAMQALASLQLPNKTRPVFERIARGTGSLEARVEAIRLIGKYRNLRDAGLLTVLAVNKNRVIAEAAQAALDHMIEAHGGRRAVTQKMMERARQFQASGQWQEAQDVLEVAKRVDPYNGKILYELARAAVA